MKVLHLRTGCRLHFGLMELAAKEPLQYAGLGLMLDQPGFELSITSVDLPTGDSRVDGSSITPAITVDASEVELPGESNRSDSAELKLEYEHRMAAVARRQLALACATSAKPIPACHIRLISALPMHSGLGAGTQLACAVATGIELFARGWQADSSAGTSNVESSTVDSSTVGSSTVGISPANRQASQGSLTSVADGWCSVLDAQPPMSAEWLTQAAGRGLRSAIGLFGFLHGGLILDEGYAVDAAQDANAHNASCHSVRPLAAQRTSIASAWRGVLIVPQHRQAVSGAKETEWMTELGSLPNPRRNDMLALAREAFSLAPQSQRFADFTGCLDHYMELAGQLFSRYQGGLYNGQDVATAVDCARRIGLRGIGQSSWGPTVFGFAETPALAQQYAAQLTDLRPEWCVRVATPAAHAAQYRWQ